ncbi:helix-hairpin-helix domain-containing protein [Candidatus Margulisiibacteriota bacterium]
MISELSREQQLMILGLVLVIVSGLGVMTFRRFIGSADASEEILIETPKTIQHSQVLPRAEIIVHVTGAVEREGVYKLKQGDRIIDALELSGGASPLANLSSINLAEKVKDGQKVIIPAKRITVVRGSGNPVNRKSGTASSSGKVSINSASEKDLCKVRGVGPTTAKRIVEYRSSNGPFSKIEDIMKVKSIGKSKFGKIKGQIIL